MRIFGLVIAKGESRRLGYKNLRDFNRKPMFLWNILKCIGTLDKTYVSSDNLFILNTASKYGAFPIMRPKTLLGEMPNIPVYQHAQKKMKADIIVAVQANSPTIESGLIEMVREIMVGTGCPELMTCHPDYSIYGSIWALTAERLENYKDPYKFTPEVLIVDDSIDIHTLGDLKRAKDESRRKHNSY